MSIALLSSFTMSKSGTRQLLTDSDGPNVYAVGEFKGYTPYSMILEGMVAVIVGQSLIEQAMLTSNEYVESGT